MTTASAHQAMVEALRKAQAALDEIAARDVDWRLGTADNVNLLQAMAEEALYEVVPALEGWEKRPRLAEDTAVWSGLVAAGLISAVGLPPTETAALWVRILDALERAAIAVGEERERGRQAKRKGPRR